MCVDIAVSLRGERMSIKAFGTPGGDIVTAGIAAAIRPSINLQK